MSVEAITWALNQPIQHSSAKFVLVVLANCASRESMTAHPSVAYIAEATGQNRKTVIENVKRLVSLGYIEATGDKKGITGQVVVYKLLTDGNNPKNGIVNNLDKSTENGTVKESQKRNSTENGTVPKTVRKSPKNGSKESQKRDTEPLEPLEPKDKERTFAQWMDSIGDDFAIQPTDPIFTWAESVGIPDEWVELAWHVFVERFSGNKKKYSNWRQTFRNYIQNDWLKLWRVGRDGQMELTTAGHQHARAVGISR